MPALEINITNLTRVTGDYRVPESAQYVIDSIMGTLTSTPYVEGTFTDDVTGLPAEHDHAPGNSQCAPPPTLPIV